MTGPWDSDRDRVQRDFGFRFDFEARGRANFEAGVQAPGRLEGQPVWSGIFTAGYIGNLCRVTRSLHGYGLATVSGERAWFCPRFAPLPEWLLPPPARGHPVSSRGRIERHGAYRLYRGSGRSRELRREPVRGAACQSEMQQFVWCSGTHRVAWRSTMPETVASLDLAEQASKGLGRMPFGGVRGHTARHGEGVGRITHTGSFQKSLSASPTQDSGRTKCLP